MPPAGFSAATVLDEVRAGATLQVIADGHSMDEVAGAVRDALTGLRLGVSSLDEAALHRVSGLELWSIAEIAGHVLMADEAAHAIARSLALGRVPADIHVPYGEPGDPAATRDSLLAGIHGAEERLAATRVLAAGGPTFAHDELGALDARGWILFIGLHAAVHLHQAAAVVRAG
ncbi:MAG TPA: DinB family protein [Candidatus Limnocylindria bacterium]|nr:DinB family protein [Candidatus Limnocylindria bacterium]